MWLRVISMTGLPRRARAQSRFNALGTPWKFIDGVDVRGWPPEALAQVCDQEAIARRLGRLAYAGEIGCALAHRQALADFLASDEPSTVILEEDAVPGPAFENQLRSLATLPDRGIDILLMYTGCTVVHAGSSLDLGTFTLSRCAGRADHNLAYWVTRKAAQQLLAAQPPRICALADWPLPLTTLNAHVTHEPWVTHDRQDSVIDPMRQRRWLGFRFTWRCLKQCLAWNTVGMRYHLHDLAWTRLLKWRGMLGLRVISQSQCDVKG
ncbi:MAG: glycosyltransferase family 25 protein [Alphaproteobacteria bacterium]|nr:glycosyltransferase family 25 protein [Alphaproteobacteria bacterium]